MRFRMLGSMEARSSCVNCSRLPSGSRRTDMELARRLVFLLRALCSQVRKAFHRGTFCRNTGSGFTCSRRVRCGLSDCRGKPGLGGLRSMSYEVGASLDACTCVVVQCVLANLPMRGVSKAWMYGQSHCLEHAHAAGQAVTSKGWNVPGGAENGWQPSWLQAAPARHTPSPAPH